MLNEWNESISRKRKIREYSWKFPQEISRKLQRSALFFGLIQSQYISKCFFFFEKKLNNQMEIFWGMDLRSIL
jgi:hypothetical protein